MVLSHPNKKTILANRKAGIIHDRKNNSGTPKQFGFFVWTDNEVELLFTVTHADKIHKSSTIIWITDCVC